MDEEQRRLERISSLRDWLTRFPGEDTTVTHGQGTPDGLPEPELIDSHQPQLLARGLSNTLIIGLVEMGPDFTDEQSLNRFRALGKFLDPATGERAALNVAVPKELLRDAERGLEMAGLTSDQFTVYGLPF